MEHILKSWDNFLRFLIIVGVVFVILLILLAKLTKQNKFNINFQNGQTLVTIIDDDYVAANSILPASDCWINTGIEVRPGETCEIKVAGKVCASAEKMIDAAVKDTIPIVPWIGPEGSEFKYHNTLKMRWTNIGSNCC